MQEFDHEDDRELMDVPPDEPAGSFPVTFQAPVPRIEQIAGEVARQLLSGERYGSRDGLAQAVRERLDFIIDEVVTEKAKAAVEELLTKPIRPTDAFGNPIGEPTTLHGALGQRILAWVDDPVDGEGKVRKGDSWNKSTSRMEWLVAQVVSRELQNQISTEVTKITKDLKAAATAGIAKQIADRLAGMIIK